MRRLVVLLAGLVVIASVAATSSGGGTRAEARWVVTDIGSCPSYNCWSAMAINERGQIVGQSGERAFLWEKGKRISLGVLPGTASSEAVAINERRQIVGSSGYLVESSGRAFLWEEGHMRNLGVLPGMSSSAAVAINDGGQVAGYDWKLKGQFELPSSSAFTWEKGQLRSLPTLPGEAESEAVAINNNNWIIGWSSPGTHGGGREAVVWRNGSVTGLEKLGALTSEPIDINERGQIVGSTSEPDRVFLWEKGKMRIISKQWSDDLAIDDLGRVIGSVGFFSGSRVFIWEKGRMRFIGSGVFIAANERGQSVGWTGSQPYQPRLWENGKSISLPLLRGHKSGVALALNERDQIVGWSGNVDHKAKEEDVYKGRLVLWTLKRG